MTTDTTPPTLTDAEWKALTHLFFLIDIEGATAAELTDHPGAAALVKAVQAGYIILQEEEPATRGGR